MASNNLAVVVLTCDHYSDLWPPFFEGYSRHWKGSPWPIYLASNQKDYDYPGLQVIKSGEDKDWSSSIRSSLSQLEEEYVLLLIDDIIFTKDVDFEKLSSLYQEFIDSGMNYLRLKNSPLPDIDFNQDIGEISKDSLYRTAIFPSIWKKDVLFDILKDGESAWEFELKGSVRSDNYGGFYSVYEDVFEGIHGVIKGKWTRQAVKELKQVGINFDSEKRGVMSFKDDLKLRFVFLRSRVFRLVPAKYQRKLRELIYKKILGRSELI
ncbi:MULTISPECIES: hypothetical protein [unclassified Pseudoalteromonas]|uniref:hypothetical protein n=1 Tax=unclassified Pseudoalteromonas TaxID=194690 RepID=UPI0020975F53|nr:hypothetical protein [Pseudoalteromonas sp. XMcav2-N]MCO7188750.1 hypothetical protein [Pseudoalteromonas sp. XMcav2-N]